MQFTNSISEKVELITELLRGVRPAHRKMAQRAAVQIENTFMRLQKDNPKNAAVALGAAFAVFKLAERLCEKGEDGKQGNLIQLLQ